MSCRLPLRANQFGFVLVWDDDRLGLRASWARFGIGLQSVSGKFDASLGLGWGKFVVSLALVGVSGGQARPPRGASIVC